MAEKGSDLNQYLAAFVANLLSLCYGIAIGWASPNLLLLTSDESPLLSGKISTDEASWIVALLCVGGFIGNLFCGYITNKIGRKGTLISIAIPDILAWMLVLFGQNVYYLYAARFIIGFVGGGVFLILPQYLSEIASDSIRGVLGSTLVLIYNFGIVLGFILGSYCDYYTSPKVVILLISTFLCAFYFFPESPTFLMKQSRISSAEMSIRFYQRIRGNQNNQELLEFEMNKLKSTCYSECGDDNLTLSDFGSREARKAMLIGAVLALMNQLCGAFAMLNYTATIFKESGSSMSPNMSAIVVGVIQLVGSGCPTVLVDRTGRKFLLAVSAIGAALGLISLGTYSMLKLQGYEVDAFKWVPITSFSFFIFIACWGVVSLPFLVISEIMPEKLKSFGSTFCLSIVWIVAFILCKFFPFLSDVLGMHGAMFLFAGCSLCGALFVILVLPETKNKSYAQIMQSLR